MSLAYFLMRRKEIIGHRRRKPKHNARQTVAQALASWNREELQARAKAAANRLDRALGDIA